MIPINQLWWKASALISANLHNFIINTTSTLACSSLNICCTKNCCRFSFAKLMQSCSKLKENEPKKPTTQSSFQEIACAMTTRAFFVSKHYFAVACETTTRNIENPGHEAHNSLKISNLSVFASFIVRHAVKRSFVTNNANLYFGMTSLPLTRW